ncbi:hypothetical protein Riv7116_3575 [Rivularia sp. PCC 7116]|uniref:hypothetical protein n=1 Tax=Rivularia sp. PCC 7116 TaxID=373994 RepID=UPI00029EE25D|nr:hypothetical protein [Rivularia sp. PCC 7116]AFY56026.1 hypothetical protein Riv7116_3575 [Rivularia sp. PCC 7116]
MFNHLQQITIEAFITALAELDAPLPADLQKQINQVGAIFSTQPTVAIDELVKLAEHPFINQLYQQARVKIQSEYQTKERNRNRKLVREIDDSQDEEYNNLTLDNRTKSVIPEAAGEVLQADNPQRKAKKYVVELKIQRVSS